MKEFMGEYGLAIVAATVIIILITMTTPIGDRVRYFANYLIHKFTGSTAYRLGMSHKADFTVLLTQENLVITSTSNTEKYGYIIHYENSGIDCTKKVTDVVAGTFPVPLSGLTVDPGGKVFVEVISKGSGAVSSSNTILFNKSKQDKLGG